MQTKKQTGFTLIELMITLVVLVIALSIAVPSFATWIKNNRIDAATRTLAGALKLARSEAISRQTIITIDNGGNWNNGVTIYTAAAGNNSFVVSDDTLIKDLDYTIDGITVNSNDDNNFISFTNKGTLSTADAPPLTLTLCQTSGESDGFQITINTVGRASINNKSNCP